MFRRQVPGLKTPEFRVPGLGEDARPAAGAAGEGLDGVDASGPHPASRVAIGLALGLGIGLLSALLLPPEDKPETGDPRSLLPPP